MKATTKASGSGSLARALPPDVLAWLPRMGETQAWIVCAHMNPDADTLGSALAFASLLRRLGAQAIVACQDEVKVRFDFMPGVEDVWVGSLPPDIPPDVGVIACDAATFDRLGTLGPAIAAYRPLVNVDHHISNPNWGSHNLVDAGAAATGEIVYLLYEAFGVPIDRDAATCLYAAIITDTGSFRYPATTPRTLAVAAKLIAAGVDAPGVGAAIYERRTAGSLRLLGHALASLQMGCEGKLAWITLPLSLFNETGATEAEAELVIEKLREIGGVEGLFVARESADGTVRVSFRSKGTVDVNQIAGQFGGGGHRQASGATLRMTLSEAEAVLIAAFEKLL